MKYASRIYYTETDKSLMWDRWLFSFEDKIHRCCVADIEHFVPCDTVTTEAASRRYIDLANAAFINNLHSTTRNRVAKMRGMIVALMSYAGGKGAAQDSLP